MYQPEPARSGHFIFKTGAVYLRIVVAISVNIACYHRSIGSFASSHGLDYLTRTFEGIS